MPVRLEGLDGGLVYEGGGILPLEPPPTVVFWGARVFVLHHDEAALAGSREGAETAARLGAPLVYRETVPTAVLPLDGL